LRLDLRTLSVKWTINTVGEEMKNAPFFGIPSVMWSILLRWSTP